MPIEEKKRIARDFYANLGLSNCELESSREEDIKADYIWVPNLRGPGGLLIGDNGDYLFCQSSQGISYWKEEYASGKRSNVFYTKELTDENIKLVISAVNPAKDVDEDIAFKLVKDIIAMPEEVETTIATLLNIDNSEVAMVEPYKQGVTLQLVQAVCRRLDIKIEVNRDSFGGLAYHLKFKKVNQ